MAGTHAPLGDVHEAIFGPVSATFPPIDAQIIVNPGESLPTGWGAPNVQQFQSSHVNALPTNPAAEQGAGVGPERKWAHYPHAVGLNPFRRMAAMLRDGGDSYSTMIYRPEVVAYWSGALAHELAATPVKQAMRPSGVANQPPWQPYVSVVPPISPGGY